MTKRAGAVLDIDPTPMSFADVVLKVGTDVNGRKLPPGSVGTVVHCHKEDAGFEVEFSQPFHAVVTISSADVESMQA